MPLRYRLESPWSRANLGDMAIRLGVLLLLLARPLSSQTPDSLGITAEELGARLRFFSSDLLEGRYPGTRGETLATSYLISELQSFGVVPGASQVSSNSAWLQAVELLVQRPDSTAPVQARLTGRITRALAPGREITFVNAGRSGDVNAAGELVFVGYGIDAPIYRWNDFAGLDLEGKIAIVLTGEPTLSGDTVRFNGVRASRFSWFEDKLADLQRRRAAGVLIIRPDGSLQGPVRVGRYLAADVSDTGLRFIGGITDSALARLVPPASRSLSALIESANQPGFRAVPFGVRLSVRFR